MGRPHLQLWANSITSMRRPLLRFIISPYLWASVESSIDLELEVAKEDHLTMYLHILWYVFYWHICMRSLVCQWRVSQWAKVHFPLFGDCPSKDLQILDFQGSSIGKYEFTGEYIIVYTRKQLDEECPSVPKVRHVPKVRSCQSLDRNNERMP